jgi:SSS family solute:Na+ symporter
VSGPAVVLAILVAYIAAILVIGAYSARRARATMEDFHMGGREFRALILFSTVFGANISAVTLIGIPGMAYHVGWIAWPYFVTAWSWLTPLLFYVVGARAWSLGKQYGHMTMAEMIGGRWGSPGLAMLVSGVSLLYTVPYLMTGLRGAGITLQALSDGAIPFWAGALVIALIVLSYVTIGGMRGAAWVNVLQTVVFLVGGVTIFVVIAGVLGGPAEATRRIAEQHPDLLSRARMPWRQFFSYGVIVAAATALFPQVFMRVLTGRNPAAVRQLMVLYPFPALAIFFVMAYLGMWGRAVVPGLEGGASDRILPILLSAHAPVWATGLLGAAVFAAMMSTMDSQLLSVTTMITRDFLFRTRLRSLSERTLVSISRIIVVLLTALSYVLALVNPLGIIRIVEFAFAGFACLIPVVLGAFHWRRCTREAACASIIGSQAVLLALTFGWIDRAWTFGFLPGLPAMAVGVGVLVVVSVLTPASEPGPYFREAAV